MSSRIRRVSFIVVWIVAILSTLSGCVSPNIVSTPTPTSTATPLPTWTPTPAPTATSIPSFIGRILILGTQADGLVVYEFKPGMDMPQPLWTRLPGKRDPYPNTEPAVTSPNGRYVVLPGEHLVLDLTDGKYTQLDMAPDIQISDPWEFFAVFSSDNVHLAYGVQPLHIFNKAALYVINLSTGAVVSLYESPCSSYLLAGIVCGKFQGVHWIDDRTLVYNGFAGSMPRTVTSPGYFEVNPDKTRIVTVEGKIIEELEPIFFDVNYRVGAGPTMLVMLPPEHTSCGWLEAAELKQGIIKPRPIESYSDYYCGTLSSDGKYIVQGDQKMWRLIEIRTGREFQLPSISTGCYGPIWSSPDGKSIACRGWDNGPANTLHIVSFQAGSVQVIAVNGLNPNDWDVLAWLP